MDYLDQVFVDLKDKKPGRYPLDSLREPERFISAVKFLMDGQWLTNVYFSEDYKSLTVQEPFDFATGRFPSPRSINKLINNQNL